MFEFHVIQSGSLLVARPKGLLDFEAAERLVDFVELKEEEVETGFDRFCDLSHVDGIHLPLADVLRIAVRRRAFNPNDIHVKSAFFATNALAFGIASMYEHLLNSSRIEVRVWGVIQLAADWLGVNVERLTL